MTRKTWSEGDISAYLDGRLETAARAAFEADLARDGALRRQVGALRAIVALLRAAPLREPPRNYLLTPAMVAAPARRLPSRPRPLLWMRLATALTAVAFAISLTLTLLRGPLPTMAPAAMYDSAPPAPGVAETALLTAEPMLMAASPAEEGETAMLERQVENTTGPTVAVSAPDESPPGLGGMGNAFAEQDASPIAESQPAPLPKSGAAPAADDAPTPEPQRMMVEALPETTAGESLTLTQPLESEGLAAAEGALETEDVTLAVEPEAMMTPAGYGEIAPAPLFPPPWVTGGLGVVTLMLAGVTLWLWRRD